jgi:hypothetical protein
MCRRLLDIVLPRRWYCSHLGQAKPISKTKKLSDLYRSMFDHVLRLERPWQNVLYHTTNVDAVCHEMVLPVSLRHIVNICEMMGFSRAVRTHMDCLS